MSAPLAPGFLIASPPLGDPNFERTVVLLALHGPRGALGFVVNRIAPAPASGPARRPASSTSGVPSSPGPAGSSPAIPLWSPRPDPSTHRRRLKRAILSSM
jgi:hypothetical protein